SGSAERHSASHRRSSNVAWTGGGAAGPAPPVRIADAARAAGDGPRRLGPAEQASRRRAGDQRGHREDPARQRHEEDAGQLARRPGEDGRETGRVGSRMRIVGLTAILLFAGVGCARTPREPVSLTYLDVEWEAHDQLPGLGQDLRDFERETGIKVKRVPAP